VKIALSTANAPRMLVRSARLLAAIGGLAMATTGECSPIVLVAFLTFFLIGFQVQSYPALSRGLSSAQPFFALVVFAMALADFFTGSQSFLLSVAHFLLGIQALRLIALRTNRENLGSALVSSLMVLSASTLAVDWTFFLMLTCFLPALVWTLMLHTIALESDVATGGDAAHALQGSNPVWRQMAPALRSAAVAAFAIAAFCCAFVFMTFPRFNLQGFRGQFLQPLHKTGFTSQVDLEKGGAIYEDPAIVMRVEVAEADRSRWTGYMRGSILDQFDGRIWRRASRPIERAYPTGLGEFRLRPAGRGPWIRQSIYLESMDTPVLFAASHPFFIKIERPYLEVMADGTVQRRQSDAWRIHYEAVSAVTAGSEPFLTGGTLQSRGVMGAEVRRALDVPDRRLNRLAELASAEGGAGSTREIAERMAEYLRTTCTYSLVPGAVDRESPIERFVFTTRRGHCELFASTLAMMLRYRGIPARIVTGFMSREWNERGDYYIVRMRHAHAWVEYYSRGNGWTEIDPSPRSVDEGETGDAWKRRARESWDYMNLRWNRYILSYDLEKQVSLIRSVSLKSGHLSSRFERLFSVVRHLFSGASFNLGALNPVGGSLKVPVLPVVLAGLAALIYFGFRSLRRSRRTIWFYRPLVKILEGAGAARSPGRTLRELAATAAPRLGEGAESARILSEIYYRLRFEPGAALSREERGAVSEHLRRLKTLTGARA